MITDKDNSNYYQWGGECESWELVDEESLSVKQELMPPLTREALHYHTKSLQYFYIQKGIATFYVEGHGYTVTENRGIKIAAGKKHYIENREKEDLEFLVISQPNTKNDRVNVEE